MNIIPTLRAHALRQPIDFGRYNALRQAAERSYRITLSAWCTVEVWVKGIDEHDAKEAAALLWAFDEPRISFTGSGIHDLSELEIR